MDDHEGVLDSKGETRVHAFRLIDQMRPEIAVITAAIAMRKFASNMRASES